MRSRVVNHFRDLTEQLVDGSHIDDVGCILDRRECPQGLLGTFRLAGLPSDEHSGDNNGHSGHKRPDPALSKEGLFNVSHILEPFVGIGLDAFPDDGFLVREKEGDHLAKGPNVTPVVNGLSREEFRRGEGRGASGTLENREGISVGETEVDEFDVVPVVGDKNVRGFDVPVDNLLGVEIPQGVTELKRYSAGSWIIDSARQELSEGDPVNPFHLDTVPESRNVPEVINLPDGGVGKAVADLVFLAKEGLEFDLSPVFRFQGLYGPESTVLVDTPDLCPSALGAMDEHGLAGLTGIDDHRVSRGEKCGVVRHGVKVNVFC